MSGNNNVTVNSVKGFSTLVRPKFGPGMLLQHDDLEQLSTYTRELSRLLFRSFFGCGVVCGLCVRVEGQCGKMVVTVNAGLALDCSGDPIYLPKDQSLSLDEQCDNSLQGPLWVVLCGTTKCCSPRASMCSTDDDAATSACTRERDAFEIRIVSGELPEWACHCPGPTLTGPVMNIPDCYADHNAGVCGCGCAGDADCGCCGNCVLLAMLMKQGDGKNVTWKPDYTLRRFVRPALIPDPRCPQATPKVAKETPAKKSKAANPQA